MHISFVRLTAAASRDAVPSPADLDTEAMVTALTPHLRAELGAREIGVCTAASPTPTDRPPIAEIVLHRDPEHAALVIVIRDLVTDKQVERVLDLANLPADTRLLAVATSIDELLRASWLETLLTPARAEAPAPIQRAVRSSLPVAAAVAPPAAPPPPRHVHAELGALASTSLVPGLRTAFGLDVQASFWPTARLGGYARLGGSRGVGQDSLNGSIAADVLRAGAGAMVGLVPAHEKVGVRLELELDVARVTFRGQALPNALARDAPALAAVTGTLGLRSWLDVGPVRCLLGVAAAYAALPAVGTDRTLQGRTFDVTGLDGLGFEASLGGAWAF